MEVFIREIAAKNLTDEVLKNLEESPEFVLKWKEDSVEIWYHTIEEKLNDQ